ncbi:hypothetical protein R1flu_022241 [Riccia fluitans]|uniref:Uncharacterized protein n=1 Tax=Riccia fluitans TaxID=41844 RepID=A0ABD1ZRP4_9MARC
MIPNSGAVKAPSVYGSTQGKAHKGSCPFFTHCTNVTPLGGVRSPRRGELPWASTFGLRAKMPNTQTCSLEQSADSVGNRWVKTGCPARRIVSA